MMNEYLYNYALKFRRRVLPSRLVFFITNKCNLFCKHCFYQKQLNKSLEELSVSEIEKISFSLAKVYTLLISGGEPFLRTDLPEICKIFYKQNGTKTIYIPTNGILKERILSMSENIAKRCKDCQIIIGVSLDGPREQNDSIRGVGTFDIVLKNLPSICEIKKRFKNVSVNICTTIFDRGYSDTMDLFELIKRNTCVSYHAFSPFRKLTTDNLFSPPTYENWLKITNDLSKLDKYYFIKAKEKGIRLRCHALIKKYVYNIITESLNNKKWPFQCLAGHLFGVIEPNGDIRMCEASNVIGNLRESEYNFKEIWFSQKAKITKKQIKDGVISKCRHCTYGCSLIPSLIRSPISLFKALTGLY